MILESLQRKTFSYMKKQFNQSEKVLKSDCHLLEKK